MNKQQRKVLDAHAATLSLVEGALEELAADDSGPRDLAVLAEAIKTQCALLDDIRSALEETRDEEQEKYDNMPESLQSGDRGTTMEAGIDQLNEAIDGIESAINDLEALSLEGDEVSTNEDIDEAMESARGHIDEAITNVNDAQG